LRFKVGFIWILVDKITLENLKNFDTMR
jgi:hypothetical protein